MYSQMVKLFKIKQEVVTQNLGFLWLRRKGGVKLGRGSQERSQSRMPSV